MSTLLAFDQLHNIRDLGGEQTMDGRKIISGRLIRCGHLAELSEEDRTKLTTLVDTIVDLRTAGERDEKPDLKIEGTAYHHIPIMDSLTAGITREEEADQNVFTRLLLKPKEAKEYMCEMYRAFARNDQAISQYSKFLQLLMEPHARAVLWHCTAGKDRAGIGAAILEEILGVPREAIIADYLTTNIYLQTDIAFLTEFVKEQAGIDKEQAEDSNGLADESLKYLFGAEREYIEAFYEEVDEKYGNYEGLVRNGLQLSPENIDRLKKLYLE